MERDCRESGNPFDTESLVVPPGDSQHTRSICAPECSFHPLLQRCLQFAADSTAVELKNHRIRLCEPGLRQVRKCRRPIAATFVAALDGIHQQVPGGNAAGDRTPHGFCGQANGFRLTFSFFDLVLAAFSMEETGTEPIKCGTVVLPIVNGFSSAI